MGFAPLKAGSGAARARSRLARPGTAALLAALGVELVDELVDGTKGATLPLIRHDLALNYVQVGLLTAIPLIVGSLLVPVLVGVALGDLLHGLPIAANHEYTGSFWNLLQPYGIMTGVTLAFVCVLHGATFITIKTTGDVRFRASRLARRVAPVTALLVLAFISWTHVEAGGGAFLNVIELLACLAVIAAWALVSGRREGWSFAATTVTIGLCIITIFVDLYPNVMVSSTNPAYSLTVHNSAATPYTLKVMTVVALVLLPIVLAYQAWTYYVFRRRISDQSFRSALPTTPRPAVSATVAMASQGTESAHAATASPAPHPQHGLWRRNRRGARGRRE